MPRDYGDVAATYRLFNEARRLATMLAGMAAPPRLFVLTRNAQPIDDGERANPAHAILWGLVRTLALEQPQVWGGILDVDDQLPPELVVQHLLAEVRASDGDDQVVYRLGRRHVPRLQRRTPPTVPAAPLDGDGSHLVIGATGSIGPGLIRQLSAMGASTIVAVSRNPGTRLDELAGELSGNGTTLVAVAADAADENAMTALFGRFGVDLPALDGIYLAALAGGPALLDAMSDDDVTTMFRPKLDAVAVLHRLSLKTPVRHFVLFSSITGLIGSRWLGHYTAAGTFLATFAYARRALGLTATVVDCGLWRSVDDEQPETTDVGLRPMPNDVAIRALPAVLGAEGGTRRVVVAADWARLATAYRMRASLRVIDELLPADDEPVGPEADDGTAWRPAPHWITIKERVDAAISAPGAGTLLGEHVRVDTTPPVHLWQAWLTPEAKPYPGSHRIRGVDVVPVSVLLQTLSAAAAECRAAAVADVRFTYPIVVDAARVIQVVADDEAVTVSSAPTADTPAHRWVEHARARVVHGAEHEPVNVNGEQQTPDHEDVIAGESVAELQQKLGVEGQSFAWSIDSCRSTRHGVRAQVHLPEASTVALLDAAVYVARLADTSDERLMLPAAADHVRVGTGFAEPQGVIEVRRRDGDEFIVDIVVSAADGNAGVEIRGLHYAALDAAETPAPETSSEEPVTVQWSQLSAAELRSELETRLRDILAQELEMPPSAVDVDRSFPELGLDSMMAMTMLRETKQVVGVDVSATMLWNHPTISSLAATIAETMAPRDPADEPDHHGAEQTDTDAEVAAGSEDSLLDSLFDSVESGADAGDSGLR